MARALESHMSTRAPDICPSCQSKTISIFTSEMAIHFEGLANIDEPIVFMFPEVSVCLNCGLAQFTVPERELRVLVTHTPVEGTVVLLSSPKRAN